MSIKLVVIGSTGGHIIEKLECTAERVGNKIILKIGDRQMTIDSIEHMSSWNDLIPDLSDLSIRYNPGVVVEAKDESSEVERFLKMNKLNITSQKQRINQNQKNIKMQCKKINNNKKQKGRQ